MRTPVQKASRQAVRKVVGFVLIIPLLLPLMQIPFDLKGLPSIATLAGSFYGAWYAWQHTSRGVAISAGILALLNFASWVLLSQPSIVWFIVHVTWAYGSGNWIHWRF